MNESSSSVARFYERHPYPPPTDDLEGFESRQITETPSPAYYWPLLWPDGMPQDGRILVAGCGTAQAAKLAIQNPDFEVLGIDFSETSLAASAALKQKYKLSNLTLQRLPIEESAQALEGSFDLIISTGVLHHLPDPDIGLKALHALLSDTGCLHLKVYAPYGRAGVYMMQDYCRVLDVEPSEIEIRDLLNVIRLLPEHHPLRVFERRTPDLSTIGGTADALLHPQDRAYSAEQLYDWLANNGLSLERWFFQAPYRADCSKWRESPHAERLMSLPEAEQATALELLRADRLMHEIIACRDDAKRKTALPEDEVWLSLRVHPIPGIRLNQLGVPKGVAGQLWHPAHQAEDIRADLNETELALYQIIDGNRRGRDIVGSASALLKTGSPRQTVGDFLRKLWRFDAVMFSR